MESYNPWWTGESDYIYEEWVKNTIHWIPNLINEITLTPFALHFLSGPRQVGKTTTLKILIKQLLDKGKNPYSIFYYQCDELLDYLELGEIIDNYLLSRNARNVRSSLIILDEIPFVKEWWRAIKTRIDKGLFKNDILIISGSASLELLKERERFPGRRGNGMDYIQNPLNFFEYVKIFNLNLVESNLDITPDVEKVIQPNLIYKNRIRQLFNDYLSSGGFPLTIQDYYRTRKIETKTKRTYLDWIRGDIRQIKKNEMYMKEIFAYLLQSRGSAISWQSIAQNTSINSPHTSQSYIEALKSMYLVEILYQISPTGKILYRKNKKIHFIDPFIIKVLAEYTKTTVLEENIVENIVAAHFSQKFLTYFWKNNSEVDIIALIKRNQVGYEIKWGPKRWKKPLHLKNCYKLSKDSIPVFLASINWKKEI
ncbi:MAG: ATP-binding protein [Promethearchaeota archaeon]